MFEVGNNETMTGNNFVKELHLQPQTTQCMLALYRLMGYKLYVASELKNKCYLTNVSLKSTEWSHYWRGSFPSKLKSPIQRIFKPRAT